MPDTLFAPIEPYATGWLDVPGEHRLRYEQCGEPGGIPAVFLHGGPGSSINATHRRFFDPRAFRVVLYDQRGCGQSTPRGETRQNTTPDLVDDLERLRAHLGIGPWLVFGGSWGSTLALAYAQSRPAAVSACILRGVFLGTDAEVEWFLIGLQRFLPEAWEGFVQGAPVHTATGLLHHFQALVERGDAESLAAAARWTNWESSVIGMGEAQSSPVAPDSAGALDRVRVQLHYLLHSCFLAPEQLMHGLDALRDIPAIVVQGRRDLVCPPVTACRLTRAWPGAQLRMVEDAGHSATHPSLAQALVQALQDIRPRLESR